MGTFSRHSTFGNTGPATMVHFHLYKHILAVTYAPPPIHSFLLLFYTKVELVTSQGSSFFLLLTSPSSSNSVIKNATIKCHDINMANKKEIVLHHGYFLLLLMYYN